MIRVVTNSLALGCAVAVVLIASAASAAEGDWEKYTSQEEHFTVSFPGKPKVDVKQVKSDLIAKESKFEVNRDHITFLAGTVTYTPTTAANIAALDPADLAKRLRDDNIKNTPGKVLAKKDVELGEKKHPGYELLIEMSPQQLMRQRAFYVQGRMFQMIVSGPTRESVTDSNSDRFVDSFQILE